MANGVCYLGEAAGARIIRYGQGIANLGQTTGASTDYQFDVLTWDLAPAGEVGDVVFRSINVACEATNGYHVGITPIVDGVAAPEQTFSGADTGEVQCQAFIALRGTRLAARVRTLSRQGDLTLHDIQAAFGVIRATP